ncbi:MAG: 30S ribosome-binding factor RbfA [Flavobacteriaceae bacterium]|nr:30S ribosome-binding factor RbfA [Flavobacteriaceae bacterium]
METNRQKKIAGILQEDLVDVLQGYLKTSGLHGVLISVTKVSVTTDLSIAKVYLSIFPVEKTAGLFKGIKASTKTIRHELAQRTRHQLRRMPNLEFFIDDSLEYINKIEKSLKGSEDPIENPDLLDKRKKS